MRRSVAVAVLALAGSSLVGCSERGPDTSAADAWFTEAEETVASQWEDRLVAAGGGIATQHDGEGLVTADLGESKAVSEFLVACGGDGGEAQVSLGLGDSAQPVDAYTVSCTGDYESVQSFAEPIDVRSVKFGFSAPGEPVGVSLVVLGQ